MAKNKTKILGITAVITVIILAVAFIYPAHQFSIWGISQFTLEKRGQGEPGEVMRDGNWRVMLTTSDSEMQLIDISDETARQNAVGNDYPSDVDIQGKVTVRVCQTHYPYWHIPFEKLTDITIHPKITGYFDGGKAGQTVEEKKVSLWKSQLSHKELIIPFSVRMLKTAGSSLGSMTTNYPGAVEKTDTDGSKYYDFAISFRSLAGNMQQTAVINWYNPSNPSQTAKMTLQCTIGGSEYDWNNDWIVITDANGGTIQPTNTFYYSDFSLIQNQLNYKNNDPTSYYHYWFGGGNVYTVPAGHAHSRGTGVISNGIASSGTWQLRDWDDGTVSPCFMYPVPTGLGTQVATFVIDEGYKYGTTEVTGIHDFPGWHTPSTGNNQPPYWEKHRLPLEASTINNMETTNPKGLSVVNYLATSNPKDGVTKLYAKKPTLDVWGLGALGTVGDQSPGLGVMVPKSARSWLLTFDVSTQLIDTIIVTENHLNVKIVSLTQDRTNIGSQTDATVTATLKNLSNFAGTIYQNFITDELSTGGFEIMGSNEIYFEANQQKTVTFKVRNTGNLADTHENIPFTYRLVNTAGVTTDEQGVLFTFLKGLGQPETQLTVTCLEEDTENRINGLDVKIFYGETGNNYQSFSTQDGSVTFNLGLSKGAVTLKISDPAERYKDRTEYFDVSEGVNSKILYFATGKDDHEWWENIYLWIIVGAIIMIIIAAVVIFYYKRR